MKSRFEILIVSLVLGGAELVWYESHAQQAAVDAAAQQAEVDAAVNFGKGMVSDLQNVAHTTPASTVPGFSGTNGAVLPQTQYYNHQDLNGMQTDAMVNVTSGTASDAAQYAYDAALIPKLQIGSNNAILLNADTIATDATQNPGVISVQTGDCALTDVNSPVTRIETCTAWMEPTTHFCDKRLDVSVTWSDVPNCSVGNAFGAVSAIHNGDARDHVYARVYCDPGLVDTVQLDVHADGSNGGCTDWTGFSASTSQPNEIYSGVTVQPHWGRSCKSVPVFVTGACTGEACDYTLRYMQIGSWDYNDAGDSCSGAPMYLVALGYTGTGANFAMGSPYKGYHCVTATTTNTLSFTKPKILRVSKTSQRWTNFCGPLEAQLP